MPDISSLLFRRAQHRARARIVLSLRSPSVHVRIVSLTVICNDAGYRDLLRSLRKPPSPQKT